MANYFHIIFFSLIGGVFSLIGGLLLLGSNKTATLLAKYATPFAAGALLAAVFLDLLKEGIHEANAQTVLIAAIVGVLIFFLAERFLHWFHHHHEHKGAPDPATGLIVVGDTLHNAIDGVAIAAAFLVSVPTGIVTTIAVAAHEIPQEIGDFGLLLHKGMSRFKVLLVNLLSALSTVAAAIITFAIGSAEKLPVGVLLGVSAGFLLYIAMSDIIPEIHENAPKKRLFDWQPVLLILGVLVVGGAIHVAHTYIDAGHSSESHNHANHVTDEHASDIHEHGDSFEITDHAQLPTLLIRVSQDTVKGYNLRLETTQFELSSERIGSPAVVGRGHAHVYVNGQKVARLYGPTFHLEQAKPGDEIRVSLNTDDHRELEHDDIPIEATLIIGQHSFARDRLSEMGANQADH